MASPGTFAAGQVLTAAELNALPGGIMGSDVRTTNASLTTSATTTHTVTFTAVSGRKYIAMFSSLLENISAAGAVYRYDLVQDSTRLFAGRTYTSAINEQQSPAVIVQLPSTSGSTTVTVECSVSSGTGQLTAAATALSTLVVIDVGD